MAKDTMDAFPGDTGKRKRKPPTAWELLDDAVSDGTRETIKAAMELAANPYLTPAEPIADTLDAICGDTLDTARDAARDAAETCMAQLTGGLGDIMGEMDAYLAAMPSIPTELTAIPSIPADLIDALGATLGDTPDAVKAWTEAWIMLAPTISMTDAMKCFLDAQQQHTPTNEALWELWSLGQQSELYELANSVKDTTSGYMAILNEYVRQVATENPDMLILPTFAEAARRARADGHDIPPIGAEMMLQEADEDESDSKQEDATNATDNATDSDEHPAEIETPTDGMLAPIDEYIGTFVDVAHPELRTCLASNDIMAIPQPFEELEFDGRGKINLLSLKGKQLEPAAERYNVAFMQFLYGVACSLDRCKYNSRDNLPVEIRLKEFYKVTGIEVRPVIRDEQKNLISRKEMDMPMPLLRLKRFKEIIAPFQGKSKYIPGDGDYPLAQYAGWNEQRESVYLLISYFIRLAELTQLYGDQYSVINRIFKARIIAANQMYVELANRAAILVIERGAKRPDTQAETDKPRVKKETRKVKYKNGTEETRTTWYADDQPKAYTEVTQGGRTWTVEKTLQQNKQEKPRSIIYTAHITYTHMIDDCPMIKNALDDIPNRVGEQEQQIRDEAEAAGVEPDPEKLAEARMYDHRNDRQKTNKLLHDAFTGMVKLINDSTLPKRYKNFKIKTKGYDGFKAPTRSTLGNTLLFIHEGLNGQCEDNAEGGKTGEAEKAQQTGQNKSRPPVSQP